MLRTRSLILLLLLATMLALPSGALAQAAPYQTATAITSVLPSPAFVNQPAAVTVRVTAVNPSAPIPQGVVDLRSSGEILCAMTLDAAGIGTCSITFDSVRTVPLRAVFISNDDFIGSASAELYHVVRPRFPSSVIINSHTPFPSLLNEPVSVTATVSAGYPPSGTLTIFRGVMALGDAACALPPPSLSDQCSATLDGSGTATCALPLSVPGNVTLCASYPGNVGNLPSMGSALHWVGSGNTALGITSVIPSPSLLNQSVTVYFMLRSLAGTPPVDTPVTVTSGSETCSAPVGLGHCALTFRLPHLQNVTASYPGATGGQVTYDPATSNIWVQRVNAPPIAIKLSVSQIDALLPTGAAAGTLSAVDPNPDETHIFTLVPGAGADNNAFFTITGTQLTLARGLPPAGGSFSIRVRATDPAGLFFEQAIPLGVDAGLLPETGFAPATVTRLPEQPAARAYFGMNDLTVSIPRLGVSAEVLGVPLSDDGWDAAWLGSRLGWLEGSAFPTWQGNSVLVGHNYLPDGSAGPLSALSTLRWGDQIVVETFGQRAIFSVRTVKSVAPGDARPLRHEDKAWLTLITCQGYDEATHSYRARVVVRAVLVEVRGSP